MTSDALDALLVRFRGRGRQFHDSTTALRRSILSCKSMLNVVPSSVALVPTNEALVSNSFLFLLASCYY